MAVESRSDLASRHGRIGRIAGAHSGSYRSDNPICTRTRRDQLLRTRSSIRSRSSWPEKIVWWKEKRFIFSFRIRIHLFRIRVQSSNTTWRFTIRLPSGSTSDIVSRNIRAKPSFAHRCDQEDPAGTERVEYVAKNQPVLVLVIKVSKRRHCQRETPLPNSSPFSSDNAVSPAKVVCHRIKDLQSRIKVSLICPEKRT